MKPFLHTALAVLTLGCGSDSTDNVADSGSAATLYSEMIGVFSLSCGTGCHMGGSSSGGLALDADVAAANLIDMPSAGDSSWIRVVCGDAESSSLYQKLFDPAPYGDPMPLGIPLEDDEVAAIVDWINSDECGAD